MPDPVDVNSSASSPEEDVNAADPSPATDVNTAPAASTGEKPHEETVSYERFKEVLDKNKNLELQVTDLSAPAEPDPPPETDENLFAQYQEDAAQKPDPAQPGQPQDLTKLNEQVRTDMYERPIETIQNIAAQAYYQAQAQDRQNRSQVAGIKGYSEVRDAIEQVDDALVIQAQNNPEMVRFLIAKAQA